MSNDEEIKVALTADVSDLEQGTQEGADQVAQATATMQSAVEESTAAMGEAIAAVTAGFETSAAQIVAASETMAQGVSSSTSALGAAIQAEAAAQAQALADTLTITAAEASAFNAAVTAKNEAMLRLQTAMRGGVTSAAELAEAEYALDQAMAASALTAGEYAAIINQLDAAEISITAAIEAKAEATTASTAATEAETVAIVENTAAMHMNGGVARELGVLMGEGLRGNFARMEGSAITLSNRLGLMQAVFSPLGIAIGATVGIIAGFADAVYKGEQQSNDFAKALINTGGELGVTEGQFNAMAESLRSGTTTIGTAREALMQLAQSGHFSGDELKVAGQAVVDFSALTGVSMDRAVAAIVKIQESPVKALRAANDEYHFLSLAQLDFVQKLEEGGDKVGAATAAIQLMASTNHDRLDQADSDVGIFVGWWRTLKGAISDAGDEIENFGRKNTLEQQISQLQKQIADTKNGYSTLFEAFGKKVEVYNPFHPMVADVSLLEEKLADLQKQAGDSRLATSEKALAQATQDAAIAAAAKNDAMLKGMKGTSEYTQALNEELAALKAIHQANADDPRVKGVDFDSGGNASGGEGLAKIEAYLHKKYDLKATAHASEHKLDEQELQLEEAQEGISYDKRLEFELEFWQKKMAAASKGSQEYAQAYRQVQTLQKELDDESVRSANRAAQEILHAKLAAIDQAKSAYDGEIESTKERYQVEFDSGQITAAKLAELEKDLVQKKLQADIQYLNAKMALDRAAGQSGIDAANREATAVEQAKQKAASDMLKIDDKFVKDSQKEWQRYDQQISSGLSNAVRGMLFSGQTFKQGMESIGESVASSFISNSIHKMVTAFMQGEQTKVSAAAAGAASRTTIEADAAAQTTAMDATTGKTQITDAAATAAAKAYQAVVGIPYVGPILAPIAAGVAFAGVEAFSGSLSSAAGGWDNVPADQLAMIHKNEMVMPAHLAEGIRGMIGNGAQQSANSSGGGDTHNHTWNIQTFDGRTTEQFFRKNFGAISKGISAKTKNVPQARR